MLVDDPDERIESADLERLMDTCDSRPSMQP